MLNKYCAYDTYTRRFQQRTVFSALGMVLSISVFAAPAPDAGSQLQQIPAAPVLQPAAPQIHIEQGNTAASGRTDSAKILVKSLHISGTHVYSEAQLIALTGFKPGSEMTLSDLRGMAAKIAAYYHQNGYFLTQAYVPAQDIQGGAVTIAVIEGQYGKVSLQNHSHLSNSLANGYLNGLNKGSTVATAPLENRLLLLSDLPGVEVKSTLIPGASVGTTDLIVNVTPGQAVTGSVDADNEGNRYTGKNRLGATVNINNLAGRGDVATLRALTSDAGLNYGRGSYQTQFGRARVGLAYTDMEYWLGREFAPLKAHGTARIASLYGSYPLIRSRSNNLYGQIDFDTKRFRDVTDATATINDKQVNVVMTSINGDHRDNFGGGGISDYSLTWTDGSLNIQSPDVRATDAATAQTNGHYDKLGFSALRLQSLTATTSLYVAINGQFASSNLDTSEKMELGGANAVRAYPEGEDYADEGYVLNLEVRHPLPPIAGLPGQMQWIGFIDTGTVNLNKSPWVAGQDNRRTLSGLGIGINWMDNNNFVVKAYLARKLGNAVATSAPDSLTRFWVQGVKYF